MPTESTEHKAPFSPHEQPSTMGLFAKMFREAAQLRNPAVSIDRINWLLLKTHTVGKVSLNLPNLVAYNLIQKLEHLRESDPTTWLLECLYILAHQHNEDALFLRGEERQIAIAQYAKHIPATDLPQYMIAVLETVSSVEKKSAFYSRQMINQAEAAKSEISRMASSPSQNPPDTKSDTSPTNSI